MKYFIAIALCIIAQAVHCSQMDIEITKTIDPKLNDQFIKAIHYGDFNAIKKLLNSDVIPNVNIINNHDETPLMLIAANPRLTEEAIITDVVEQIIALDAK